MPRGSLTNWSEDCCTDSSEFIQEVSFSPCGRFIASPDGYGIRLLAFDEQASTYQQSLVAAEEGAGRKPHQAPQRQPLHEVKCCWGHKSQVLSSCFSPTHMQIATGSENSRIVLYEPHL